MGFWEVLLLFICFIVVTAVADLLKTILQGKIILQQQNKRVDALFVSLLRGIMRYRLEAVKLFKGGREDEEMSHMR